MKREVLFGKIGFYDFDRGFVKVIKNYYEKIAEILENKIEGRE